MVVESSQVALCKALSCTPDDVAANRQGKLASSQRNRLLFMAAVRAGGIVVCAVVLLAAGIPALRAIDFWSVFFVLLFGGLLIATSVLLGGRVITMLRDAFGGSVEQVDGPLTKMEQHTTQGRGGRRVDYFLEFPTKGRKFAVDRSLYTAVIKDHYYRAFYAPNSQVIVGMETVGAAAPAS